jgi:vacuolar-type H+-ATPase subunit C/Vma6
LASVLAYLVLRFGEISQITAILHARVYGIPDDVLKAVLQPLGEEAA